MDHIRVDWTKIESKEEYDIFKKCAKETRTYTVTLFFIFYTSIGSIVFFMLLPVLLDMIMPLNESRRYEILFPVEMFFDTSKYFHISFPIMFVCLYVLGSASVAVYTMVLMFLQHCNGLFDLVGHIFENAIKDHEKILMNTEDEKQTHGRLIRGVKFHERTIKCNSKWYMSSTKAQKLVLMIIARSMKPSHVSIGKIFVSSMEFYISIVQTSVSYAMVIYSLRQ
ncbi:hypothetical protein KPH14_007669 [Odynerus spinipes]|uniref:Uncharacterized protein n=1 Tax=Odynerus spinipes TaxID=1348599 RepID=A0AAD9VN63_9HYME|nr:hypothetical protein KPH14_007669 [Odynerus spinipes]